VLAELQAAGWRTAYVGKWHMGEDIDDRRPGHGVWDTQELYDLERDPRERHNLIDLPEYQETVPTP
jgi:hypothetical protein